MDKIEFFRHNIEDEDIACVSEVLRSIFLTTGPKVAEFERRFAEFLQVKAAVGLSSCTGALHLALLRAGIGQGDEVITTPMTFCATVTAILESGAHPVFVDVSPLSGMIEPSSVDAAVTAKTRAIIPVHLYGRMADMRGFSDLAGRRGLVLIEDAAHALEAERDGVRPGQLSQAACFSFYATKSITCGEGGAIVCMSEADDSWYRSARHHGITRNASDRYTKQYQHWDMEMMGWKYNMDDVQAAILLGQLARCMGYRQRRQLLENSYRRELGGIEGINFIEPPAEAERSAHHLFTVLLPHGTDRDAVLQKLQEAGIGCAVNYRAVHMLTYIREKFGYKADDFPVAHQIGMRTISLPLYAKLSEDDVKQICRTVKKAIGR